jgi:hypothetical protein
MCGRGTPAAATRKVARQNALETSKPARSQPTYRWTPPLSRFDVQDQITRSPSDCDQRPHCAVGDRPNQSPQEGCWGGTPPHPTPPSPNPHPPLNAPPTDLSEPVRRRPKEYCTTFDKSNRQSNQWKVFAQRFHSPTRGTMVTESRCNTIRTGSSKPFFGATTWDTKMVANRSEPGSFSPNSESNR